jgi:predicted HTH domain antitoxin
MSEYLYIYSMSTITLQLPDTLELSPRDTIRFFAAKLYESGRLSLGRAAELTGMSKTTFAEILADYGVSLINYSLDEVINDAANI